MSCWPAGRLSLVATAPVLANGAGGAAETNNGK
jgi:hypothetical protein